MEKKTLYYSLGKIAAAQNIMASIGKQMASPVKSVQNTATAASKMMGNPAVEQGATNVLPARSLGGATQSGVKQLYQSTVGKGPQWP